VVYDHQRDRVVLFGGLTGDTPLPELWEFNPEDRTWTQVELQGAVPGVVPDQIEAFQLAYDSTNNHVYLLGGFCERPSPAEDCIGLFPHADELWRWDPATGLFELVLSFDFDGRDISVYRRELQMVFDETRSELLVFGGEDYEPGSTGHPLSNQLWVWPVEQGRWIDRTPAQEHPVGRWLQTIAMSDSGRLLMFGGILPPFAAVYDTWTWDALSGRWEQPESPALPDGMRSAPSMVYVPVNDSFFLFGGYYEGSPTSDMWAFDSSQDAWNPVAPSGAMPELRSEATMVYDPDSQKVLLFGGIANTKFLQDTWEWDPVLAEWQERFPAQMPVARYQAVAAWTPGQVVLFGGGQEGGNPPLNDLWLWNSSAGSWTEIPMSDPWPEPESFNQLAYNRRLHRLILYNGEELWTLNPDSWEWRQIETAGDGPIGRRGHSLFYDDSQGRVMVFGGLGHNSGHLSDLWSLQRGLPAHLLEIPIDQADIPPEDQVVRLQVTLVAGGTATSQVGGQPVAGVNLYLWENGRWRRKADSLSAPSDPQEISFEIVDPDILAQLPFREGLSIHLAVTPATDLLLDNAESSIVVDYAKVTVSYRLQP
jgi:hypothetical protein